MKTFALVYRKQPSRVVLESVFLKSRNNLYRYDRKAVVELNFSNISSNFIKHEFGHRFLKDFSYILSNYL